MADKIRFRLAHKPLYNRNSYLSRALGSRRAYGGRCKNLGLWTKTMATSIETIHPAPFPQLRTWTNNNSDKSMLDNNFQCDIRHESSSGSSNHFICKYWNTMLTAAKSIADVRAFHFQCAPFIQMLMTNSLAGCFCFGTNKMIKIESTYGNYTNVKCTNNRLN